MVPCQRPLRRKRQIVALISQIQNVRRRRAVQKPSGREDHGGTAVFQARSLRRAVWGHAFRNALIPIATGFGGVLGILFAGSVLIEKVFEIPGMGRLSWEALTGRDYAVFLALLALTSLLQLIGNLLSDFCYLLIDPRIHFGQS